VLRADIRILQLRPPAACRGVGCTRHGPGRRGVSRP